MVTNRKYGLHILYAAIYNNQPHFMNLMFTRHVIVIEQNRT